MGLHPSEIVLGYEKGSKKALELLDQLTCENIENIKSEENLFRAVKPAIASKLFGL